MSSIISLVGIVFGLFVLIYLAYKGHSIIWVAPLCAVIVAVLGGLNILQAYMGDYIKGVADYIISWFPAFFLGAVYGKVMDMTGKEVGEMTLSNAIFGVQVNNAVLHAAVRAYLMNQRQGTQSTLTRTEVSGGGKKPWRQKGTGHARQGSTRAPHFTGGGVVFAPKPRDYSVKMNKKEKALAIKSALTSRVAEEKIYVLDALTLDEIKTKKMVAVLDSLKVEKALVVLDKKDENVILSAKNIPGVRTTMSNGINVYDILKYGSLVITKDAVAQIEEVYA